MRCGKTVRKREMDAHNFYTHGIGSKPKASNALRSVTKSSNQSAPKQRPKSKGSMAECPHCRVEVLRKNLQKHVSKKCPNKKP